MIGYQQAVSQVPHAFLAPITCRFTNVAERTTGRVISAVVDQTLSHGDVDIAVLDALEVPLAELLRAVTSIAPVAEATVWISGPSTLCLRLRLLEEADASQLSTALGESADLVRSFFCLDVDCDRHIVATVDLR